MPEIPEWAMKAANAIGVVMDDRLIAQGLRHTPLPPPSEIALIIQAEHDAAEKDQ